MRRVTQVRVKQSHKGTKRQTFQVLELIPHQCFLSLPFVQFQRLEISF